MSPKWAKGYSRLGLAKFKAGDLAGAVKAYTAGLVVDPSNTQIADGLAEVRPVPTQPACVRLLRARVCRGRQTAGLPPRCERTPQRARVTAHSKQAETRPPQQPQLRTPLSVHS